MNFKQLQALIYVARNGTFKRAAEDLYFGSSGDDYITPESIQYRIKQLEQELGVSLYQKRQGSSRVLLTREGKLFLREALEVYQRMCEWHGMFMESDQTPLTFAATQALIIHRVIDAVKKFHRENPGVRMRVYNAPAEQAETLVLEGELDFALSTRRPESSELEYVLWRRSRMVLITPKGHPLSRKGDPTLAEIADQPLILLEPEVRGDRDLIDDAFAKAGIANPNIVVETSNSEIIAAYVEEGIGLGIMSETSVARLRRNVDWLPLKEITGRSEAGLLVRSGQYLPRRTRDFLTMLDPVFADWLKERDERLAKSASEQEFLPDLNDEPKPTTKGKVSKR